MLPLQGAGNLGRPGEGREEAVGDRAPTGRAGARGLPPPSSSPAGCLGLKGAEKLSPLAHRRDSSLFVRVTQTAADPVLTQETTLRSPPGSQGL